MDALERPVRKLEGAWGGGVGVGEGGLGSGV